MQDLITPENWLDEDYVGSDDLTLDAYQDACHEFAFYPGWLVYPAMGLCGEAGEVIEAVKKAIRDDEMPLDEAYNTTKLDPEKRLQIARECGDVLFYLAMVADDIDYTLSEIAELNLEKLTDRKERGQLGGSGDYR